MSSPPSANCWLIRSPYQHRSWDDVLMRNLFRLQGMRFQIGPAWEVRFFKTRISQTFNRVFNQWRACTTEDVNGVSVTLEELRERYRKQMGI